MILRALTRPAPAVELRQGRPPGWTDLQARHYWMGHGGLPTAVGRGISEETAMAHATVYTCVRFLARLVAGLPVEMKRLGEDGETLEPWPEHPTNRLLKHRANRRQTAFQGMLFVMVSRLLRGNSLAVPVKDGAGRATDYIPVRWDRVYPDATDEGLVYRYRGDGQGFDWSPEQVWTTSNVSLDGVVGLSPIAVQRESVGWGLGLQEYGSRHFANSATPSGVLAAPGPLGKKPEDRDANVARLRRQVEDLVGNGLENARRFLVLEEGMTWSQMSISPEDSQYLGSRKFSREEICGWFGLPPHFAGDLSQATYSNIEQQALELVVFHLLPDLVDLEQAMARDLLPESELGRAVPKFDVGGLMRGDAAARAAFYARGLNDGWMNPEEVRKVEGLPYVEGLDEFRVPLNMGLLPQGDGLPMIIVPSQGGTVGGVGNGVGADALRVRGGGRPAGIETRNAEQDAERRARLAVTFRPALEQALADIVKRERRELRSLVREVYGPEVFETRANAAAASAPDGGRTDPDGFVGRAEDFHHADGEFRAFAAERVAPALRGLAEATFEAAAVEGRNDANRAGIDDYFERLVGTFTARYAIASLRSLGHIVLQAPSEAAGRELLGLFDEWATERPASAARMETVNTSRAVAREAYRRTGVERLQWVTRGANCPYCAALSGRVIAVREAYFASTGEAVEGEGRRQPFTFRRSVGHPPAHPGCDCQVAPAP